ncbi:MAG: malto-oligosyltrehalose trehalohydrolase [Deltaproteobacteria bacterium]|nr:malto-oligosyltrehalose trehalohydrolase [Deltaproteobacteria bacterium]
MTRRRPVGAEVTGDGVHFRVWAPHADAVAVVVEDPARELVLAREDGGYASGLVAGIGAGARYRLRCGGQLLPDPASRFQPAGPFGPSQVVDPGAFAWTDAAWRGLPAHRHVVYELHVGTFTRAGTFAAAQRHLPYLAELGVTTVELMPVAGWDGAYNWGYDGVNLFAPSHAYGEPDDLRRFVDAAHARGLAVVLDVVYNHLGPSGNFLPAFGPYFLRDRTDWGDALDFARPAVRELFVANAQHWIDEYHLDGLRLDAVHAIRDASDPHILEELVAAARLAAPHRTLWIVAEDERQDATLLRTYGLDAVWNDDFHHAARVAATGVADGYLAAYRGTARELAAAVGHGFLYQGQPYPWPRERRGTATGGLARTRFVHFLENHDQVAHLMFGERLAELVDPATLRALTALLLLSPSVPMLFQGQESGSRRPFEFFCAHTGELAAAVRRGRRELAAQFAHLGTPEAQAARRDPCARATFEACILDEDERDVSGEAVAFHRDLLHLRRDDPAFTSDAIDTAALGDHVVVVRYPHRLLLANLGPMLRRAFVAEPLLAPHGDGDGDGAWRTLFSTEDPRYGGHGTPAPLTRDGLALPARSTVVLAAT